MSRIIALLLAVAAAAALWFAPQTTYQSAAQEILNPYAASIVEQEGKLRERLSDANRQLYDVVKQGLYDHEQEISVRRVGYTEEDIWQTLYAVNYDSPQLFWVSFQTLSFRDTDDGFAIVPTYSFTAEGMEKALPEYEAAADAALAALDAKNYTDPIDKLLFLHDYLIETVRYDESLEEGAIHTAYGALVNKVAVCDGYARAYHDLCLRAGLSCYYDEGSVKSDNDVTGHAWNIVESGGKYYYVDVTWDDGDYEYKDNAPAYPVVSHAYFLVGEDALRATHTSDGRFEMPACEDFNYFKAAGLSAARFDNVEADAVETLFTNITDRGRYYVEFEITDPDEFDKVVGSYEYAVGGLIEAVNKKLDKTDAAKINEYGTVNFSYLKEKGDILAMFTPES